MKIAFLPSTAISIHAKTIDERPLGGTETAIIRLAEALVKRGHQAFVFSNLPNPPVSNPLYLPLRALQDLGGIDILVAVRNWQSLFVQVKAKKRFFWTGDSYDQLVSLGLGDRRTVKVTDQFLAVSEWHRQAMCKSSGFPLEKSSVLKNGVSLELFSSAEPRAAKRLIYTSTPYRGLRYLLPVYCSLKPKHPELELHIFSGFEVYQGPGVSHPPEVLREFESLKQAFGDLPGCIIHGNVTQAQLAKEFLRSSIFAYPNCFEETSCMSAIEAQAAGCVIVTSAYGALPETVGEAGILISGTPESDTYISQFTAAIDQLLSDDTERTKLSQIGREQSRQYDWSVIAEEFEKISEIQTQSRQAANG